MKFQLLTSLLTATATLAWAVPSEINYQGRLTDANGDAVTGDVAMSLKMFDAATDGNEIYSEDIGTVTLDSNGIYSFAFGASGQSVVDREDTIAVADGSATTYTGSVSSTPQSGTLAVNDDTYSWNIVDGNPGQQATATAQLVNGFVVGITVSNGGEGYTEAPVVSINGNGTAATATAVVENGVITAINADTTGSGYTNATVSIAPPPAPYVVDYSAGTVTVTYESAPTAGTEIVASYETNDSTIVGALSAVDAHWLELSVNGSAQSPRERVLCVPFAQVAVSANAALGELRRELDKIQYDLFYGQEPDNIQFGTQSINLTLQSEEIRLTGIPYTSDSSQWSSWFYLNVPSKIRAIRRLIGSGSHGGRLLYEDGTIHEVKYNYNFNTNPYPNKILTAISASRGFNTSGAITVGLYRDDINSEALIDLENLNYRPKKVFLSDISTSGFAANDDFQVSLRGATGDLLLNQQGPTTIPNEIGELLDIVITIFPEPNLVGTNIPTIDSLKIRFD